MMPPLPEKDYVLIDGHKYVRETEISPRMAGAIVLIFCAYFGAILFTTHASFEWGWSGWWVGLAAFGPPVLCALAAVVFS